MNEHSNFLREHNARQVWHPMAHPAEMEAVPPRVIVSAEGVRITDLDGKMVIDAVGGLWNVNLGYSCDPIKEGDRPPTRRASPIIRRSAARPIRG